MKSIPDPKHYDIVPPDMHYRYFEALQAQPFERDNCAFSLVNASWLADCSLLAYCHPGFARMAYRLAGFEQFEFFQGTGTECMAAANQELLIISFRGTELKSFSALHELRSDLNILPVNFNQGGRVHAGFQKALDEIWDGEQGLGRFIQQQIKDYPQRAIWMTGHSLGGALANLCFAKTPEATGLYLFGSPRVGDHDFVQSLQQRPIWRVEHGRDPIPLLPPKLSSVKFYFESCGELVYLHAEQPIAHQRPHLSASEFKDLLLETLQVQHQRRKQLKLDLLEINQHLLRSFREWRDSFKHLQANTGISFSDHMPIYYALILGNKLSQAGQSS